LNRRRGFRGGRGIGSVLAAVGLTVFLATAGWMAMNSGRPIAPTVTSAPPTPLATLPTAGTTSSPTLTPWPTIASLTGTPPPSYALVNSCNPTSVRGATPVPPPARVKAGAFTLQVPILMYHRIVPIAEAGDSLRGLVVPPATFAAQLDALSSAGWHTITLATLANDVQAHVKPEARTFVITIDDGWDDGYKYALPILGKHGFVATYFVIAGRIDHPGFLSSIQLQALVASGDEIGDHTMDHIGLARLASSKLAYEIDAGAARIAQVTGRWPESFAYPSGVFDARAVAAVGACQSLRIAVIEESVQPPKPAPSRTPPAAVPVALETWTNRFVVPRIRVSPTTTAAKLLAALEPLKAG
jgi:peptidoglycan/xylan/chitin deacetylase (PgdA/CDA1 family)